MAHKQYGGDRMRSPLKQIGGGWKDKIEQSKVNIAKKDSIDNVVLGIQRAFRRKHGSSSGGTDKEFNTYLNKLNKAKKGYGDI